MGRTSEVPFSRKLKLEKKEEGSVLLLIQVLVDEFPIEFDLEVSLQNNVNLITAFIVIGC